MPIPTSDRISEYAAKGANLALRTVGVAPEQVHARRLRSSAPPARPDGRRVVILTPRDWAAQVNWEAMIGQALRLRGADVSFITCGGGLEICDRANSWESPPMPCRTCRHYVHTTLEAHGFPVHPLQEAWEADDPGPWPELDTVPFADLRSVEFEGVPLGELTDVPLKWFLMSASAEDDPLAPLTWRRFLRSGRRVVRGLAHQFDNLQPDVVLLLNGLFFFEAIAWALCRQRGIDVVTYERGFTAGTLVFRRDEPACFMDLSHLWARIGETPLSAEQERELNSFLAARGVPEPEPERGTPSERRGRRVVLFTNLTWDSAVIGQERAFPSLREWISAAIEFFADRPQDELVVRVHPAERVLPGKETREPILDFVAARFPTLPRNVRTVAADAPESSYDLMRWCDAGLVFTSTTGLELAVSGKPVLVAGATHYDGKGFTIDVHSPEDFRQTLTAVLEDPHRYEPDIERARRYIRLLFLGAPVGPLGVTEPVPGLADLDVSDLSELEPGRRPDFDAVCKGILEGGDFTTSALESAGAAG